MIYDINGKELTTNEEGQYSNIPERCPECNCVQNENFRDFSNKTIQICEQCETEMYLKY